jgi:hypothetical protein
MEPENRARVLAVLAIGCLLAGVVAVEAASPKKMNGTWISFSVIPPNDILGNPDPMVLPEFETFSTSGTIITSSSATVMPLTTDEGSFPALVGLGQGNWKFRGGEFLMTQWRFLVNATDYQPVGFLKISNRWTLQNKKRGGGVYQVELLDLDMEPLHSGGDPIVITGAFEIQLMPVEAMP